MDVCRDFFPCNPKTVSIFAVMNRTIIAVAAFLLLSAGNTNAQFNTVFSPVCRYKVEVENPVDVPKEKTGTSETISPGNEKSAPGNTSLSGTDSKRKGQVARYLSVCYPLSHIKVNSPYGYRKDPFTGKRKFHNGIDLHARNAKVYAMLPGKVIAVGQDRVSGKYVTLQHGNFTVSYCHLSRITVSQGQVVRAGSVVGITGNTGRSTGEHLHITIRQEGKYVNPHILFDYIQSVRQSCVMALLQ